MGWMAWRLWCSRRCARTRSPGDLFVFRAKRADRVKILAWDGTGLCLFHKRLEKGRFVWPPVQDGAIRLSAAQLGLLLEGLDWSRVRPRPVIAPVLAG